MDHIHKWALNNKWFLLLLLASPIWIGGVFFSATSSSFAQSITTSGLGTNVTLTGNIYEITGGTRLENGSNLFHSFGEFGLTAVETARFLNTTPLISTTNILGRVTNGNPSSILGTIDTLSYPGANLFLMNPAGIVFGPSATLNVGGSVTFTTANYLRLAEADGANAGIFHANPLSPSLLTSAPVAAFGFLNSSPGAITVQGSTLSVPDGQSLSLVGGNVEIHATTLTGGSVQRAQLIAPNGQIRLASAASSGEFLASSLGTAPNINGDVFSARASIQLSQGSRIDVSEAGESRVSIRSGQLILDVQDALLNSGAVTGTSSQDTILLSRGSAIGLEVTGSELNSGIDITATRLELNGSTIRSASSGIGPGGDIRITADHMHLQNGAQIASLNSGTERGGAISISAGEELNISGYDTQGTLSGVAYPIFDPITSGVFSSNASSGQGGSITISSPSTTIANGGTVATINTGDGPGGDISIRGGQMTVQEGGQIATYTGLDFITFERDGSGPGGKISIEATQSVSVSGWSPDIFVPSSIATSTFGSGKGGLVEIAAPAISLAQSGNFTSASAGDGAGGDIRINASAQLSLGESTPEFGPSVILSTNSAAGDGGAISIDAGSVRMTDLALVRTSTDGVATGVAGNITFTVNDLTVTGGAGIESSGGIGNSGNISIVAAEDIKVSGAAIENPALQSHIRNDITGVGQPTVVGINQGISLTARTIELTDRGRVLSVTGAGGGGDVSLSASDSIRISGGDNVSVRSNLGTSGTLTIQAPSIRLENQGTVSGNTIGDFSGAEMRLVTDNLALSGGSIIRSNSETLSGSGGSIIVNASSSVTLSEGSSIQANGLGTGPGGTISIMAGSSVESSASSISSTALLSSGGGINISAGQSVRLTNGSSITASTTGPGDGGNIAINAGQQVKLDNGASISASSTGPGNAGNISINAGQQFDMRNSSVTTKSEQAGGGNIEINALDRIRLVNSQVNASAFLDGGNITIDPNAVILQNSQILARAIHGAGGNITIFTPLFLADSSSLVSASSQFGLNGTVTIQSPTSNLSGSLGTLASTPSQANSLLTQRCAALANGQASSFVIAGREQLPADPGGWLSSPIALAGIDAERFGEGTVAEGTSNLEPRTSGLLASDRVSLRRLTPAGFLIANFADSEATGCHS